MRSACRECRAERTIERCFEGCVNNHNPNEAAHGNIVVIETCACGKERRTNVNGRHEEEGPWLETEASRELSRPRKFKETILCSVRHGWLRSDRTGGELRLATEEEATAAEENAKFDGGKGLIRVLVESL